MALKIRIAVISDLHAADRRHKPASRGDMADTLLLRVVNRLNRWINPDVTVLLGDLTHIAGAESTLNHLQKISRVVDQLQSPSIVLPGNYDANDQTFYSFFKKPADFIDIKGFRFLPFVDQYVWPRHAYRPERNLRQMKIARGNFDGPIISLQHVCLFPPETHDCPYNYVNAEQIIAAMRKYNICLALSGHVHEGLELFHSDKVAFTASAALYKSPFCFQVIDIDSSNSNSQNPGNLNIKTTTHQLRLPENSSLLDCHIHTPMAYCSENLDMSKIIALAEDFNLAGYGFAEHSSSLYLSLPQRDRNDQFHKGIDAAQPENYRVDQYIQMLNEFNCPADSIGLEIDCDQHGRAMLDDADRSKFRFLIGSVHELSENLKPNPDFDTFCQQYLSHLQYLINSGIKVLAHPWRIFRLAGLEPNEKIFKTALALLSKNNVAAELNFHHFDPPEQFVQMCLDAGVKLTLASDAHNLRAVGELWPHLQMLKKCKYNGDLDDILIDPRIP
ncbi:MAG: metallophosphoesterase [Sedimentisphaerales bacterium]|nr:metallophosphoesterase [Sedimentisphaerales bacterium]